MKPFPLRVRTTPRGRWVLIEASTQDHDRQGAGFRSEQSRFSTHYRMSRVLLTYLPLGYALRYVCCACDFGVSEEEQQPPALPVAHGYAGTRSAAMLMTRSGTEPAFAIM